MNFNDMQRMYDHQEPEYDESLECARDEIIQAMQGDEIQQEEMLDYLGVPRVEYVEDYESDPYKLAQDYDLYYSAKKEDEEDEPMDDATRYALGSM